MFGRSREKGRQAREAEAAGDLGRAAQLYVADGLPEEAARALLIRGDAEADPAKRFVFFTQAVALAPSGQPIAQTARRKRAALAVVLAGDGPLSAAHRHDVIAAARELEEAGDSEGAAAAYARAGDVVGQARALEQGGSVERLEELLDHEHGRERAERESAARERDVEVLIACGRRREAVAKARQLDGLAAGSASTIEARRITGPVVRAIVRGGAMTFALGDEVVVGRTEGAIQIASSAVSRRHLVLARRGGDAVVRDVGSRNGTLLRGLALSGEVGVGDGVELRLGREVPIRIRPFAPLPGSFVVEAAGVEYVAPLGPAHLGIGDWRLDVATDGWAELVTNDSPSGYLGEIRLVERVTLVAGDAIGRERGGAAVLRVLA
jgi:FHA domain